MGETISWRRAAYLQVACLWLALGCVLLAACSRGSGLNAQYFVGQWTSTRLATMLYLYENGEWEIKRDDRVLQYGVWQYKDKTLIWTHKADTGFIHDENPILSFEPKRFTLKEQNGEVTTFVRHE